MTDMVHAVSGSDTDWSGDSGTATTATHPNCCCLRCREESDGKINTNLIEQKMRSFSTKVWRFAVYACTLSLGHLHHGTGICFRMELCFSLKCLLVSMFEHASLAPTNAVFAVQAHTVATTVAYKPDTEDADQQM